MHPNVDATNIGCHAYLIGFFHPTWAPGSARAREPRLEPASRGGSGLSRTRAPSPPRAGPAPPPWLPAVRAPRARALPRAAPEPPVSRRAAPGRLRRAGRGGAGAGASGHVTRANMAAPSGVHLLVRRGKHLRDSPAGLRGGVAPSPVTRVQRDPPSRSDVAAPTNVRSVLRLRAGTRGDTWTRRRDRRPTRLLVARRHRVTAWPFRAPRLGV